LGTGYGNFGMYESRLGSGSPFARAALPALIAVVLALALGGAAAAGPLEDGLAAYESKDFAKAIAIWRPLAEGGDAAAQFRIGTMYAEGIGVNRDDAEAAKWFRRAADQGDMMAQFNLGASYAEGAGVTKDDAEAAKWFRRAADQGMSFAQLNLGIMYAEGKGVPKDPIEAVKWLDIAIYGLPAGGARSDAARALTAVAEKLTSEQIQEAKSRERSWKAKPEAK
jgi:TPR repeat protein